MRLIVSIPVALKTGTLKAQWSVRGQGIHKEGAQYDNAYVGFFGQDFQGKMGFFVKHYIGSFQVIKGYKRE